MPSINLRLTEEEHAELARWARDGHRSLQKEIIFRLFSAFDQAETLKVVGGAGRVVAELPADPHFKPDFK